MSLDKPTTAATGASPFGNGMYNLTVYNFQSTDVNQTHAASEIVWAAGAGPTNGGPLATTNNFGTTAKFTKKAQLDDANLASATSGTTTINAIGASGFTATANTLGTIITSNVPVVAMAHASA